MEDIRELLHKAIEKCNEGMPKLASVYIEEYLTKLRDVTPDGYVCGGLFYPTKDAVKRYLHPKDAERAQAVKYVFAPIDMSLQKESRCCGRCDGVNDLCVADTVCEDHSVMGCEKCFGQR